ncbi:MAG: hypothetical protein JST70_05940 [Bacteroidetes bacterium]|nr:hypothetical protein [Bacteroidota bacterium]
MKKLLIVLLSLTIHNVSVACNVCGCSASNQYLGILPQMANNFVGIQYQYRTFESTHEAEPGESMESVSKETYRTLQLWGRYNISKRIQAYAFVPYITNNRVEDHAKTISSGIGDITLLANYRVTGANCNGRKVQHTLLLGGGVKLPTGRYDKQSISAGETLPNMQPGTGSYDFIVNTNYTVQYNDFGLNLDASGVLPTANSEKYKFGNRVQCGLMAFKTFAWKQIRLIPQIGGRYEYASADYDNYSLRWANDMTGGNRVYLSGGVQASYKRYGAQVLVYQPLYQDYATGLVNNTFKSEAGLYFLF